MSNVVLSLGSNLGDRTAHLRRAVRCFGLRVSVVSSVYETSPWGPVAQDDYLNIVLLAQEKGRDAYGWLDLSRTAERAEGRVREVRWGPRTLDVDVIAVTDDVGAPVVLEDAALTLPHPRAAQRGFVLVPWAEIEPDACLDPGSTGVGRTGGAPPPRVADLVAALPESERAGILRTDVVLAV